MLKGSVDLSPEIVRVDNFNAMFEALKRPGTKAAISTGVPFAHQEAIEEFNRTGRDVYVVIGSPLSDFQEKLEKQLKKKGLSNTDARIALSERAYNIAKGFLDQKKTPDGKWDVTVTSTFLHHTSQREWHIDSYDASGNSYQLTTTLAGTPGTVVSHSMDYDRSKFESMRNERREKERWYQKELLALRQSTLSPFKRRRSQKDIEKQMKKERARMVKELEVYLAPMEGHATEGCDLVLFRGGDVPHTSPVLDRRRLVFAMVEFDDFMDLEHAEREY
jgi:hypothetical protein